MTEVKAETENTAAIYSKSPYRPEIDGLRALAVVAVIVNHFNKDILPSGYLGVDIFFIISGFVITSSLASRPAKNFSDFLLGFYTRRIKRLIPALLLFILTSSVLICIFNPDPTVSLEVGKEALFGLSNIRLYSLATDYFAASSEMNVFTHTWSLGVEEQFYFLFPFLIWFSGFGRLTPKGSRNLLFVISILSVASLIGFVYLYQTNQPAAYFLMPTRLWELGAGCLLFLGLKYANRFICVLQHIPPLLVTAGVVGALFIPLQFAVPATVAVVVLTALLITCIRPKTAGYDLFTLQPIVYIGLISYSLYLWHWGVLCLSRWTIGIHWWSVPFQVALMLMLSIASYRYVETPLRRSDWSAFRLQTVGYGMIASSCAAFILSLLISSHNSFLLKGINDIPAPPAFLPLGISNLPYDPTCVVDGQQRRLTGLTFQQCTTPPKFKDGQMIWALGDSHIGHLQGLFRNVHDQIGLGVHLIETPGLPFPITNHKSSKERYIIYEQIKQRLHPGDIVVLSRLFVDREKYPRMNWDVPEWSKEVLPLSDYLFSKGINLVIIGPPPIFQIESIELCRSSLWKRFRPYCSIERSQISGSINQVYSLLESTSSLRKNIYVFNQFELLCPSSKEKCSVFQDGVLAYRDEDHLNSYGSGSLSNPFIDFLRRFHLIKEPASLHSHDVVGLSGTT
ncbi:acyltransferase [Nostoc linckia FACHB-104]|nr:acyltransferase [Nostoc linckia FACHB-104]